MSDGIKEGIPLSNCSSAQIGFLSSRGLLFEAVRSKDAEK